MILALDLGGCTGWAIGVGVGKVSGHWTVSGRSSESPGVRYLRLRGALEGVRKSFPGIHLVVTEQAHHRGGAATRAATGYQATVEAWCAEHQIESTTVHSATLKRYATGKGNAKKADMIAHGRRKWDLGAGVSDDEVDALWILDWARTEFA